MAQDMPSWKHLGSAGSRLRSVKGYISQSVKATAAARSISSPHGPERQGWKEWAGHKIRSRRRGGEETPSTILINLFPGWAARRYAKDTGIDFPRPFEVEVFTSGFVISHRSAEHASRSQRAFIRLAKGFAALPKLSAAASNSSLYSIPLTRSTEELLTHIKLPPRPTEITDDYDVEALERQLRRVKDSEDEEDSYSPSSSASSSTTNLDGTIKAPKHQPMPSYVPESSNTTAEGLRRLHANLESRLQPFWSSVLPNRTVRLHLFASPHQATSTLQQSVDPDTHEYSPLASMNVTTAADGSFQARFIVKWDDLCHHPRALHIAFGESVEEHDLTVVAELLPAPMTPNSAPSNAVDYLHAISDQVKSHQHRFPSCMIRIPITHCPIRVISDIDDTVKMSGILSGARAVFYNVFVKDLQDSVIPGMGEWYTGMWSRGVRFHYVSNGPFEYLPVLNQFLPLSQLPPGSIKLKSYAGRSLFNGLLSAPATRKRAGVVEILNSFPNSRFFLIGDSGEQDLELYADLARERPDRILGVFVRDVTSGDSLDDPTGWKVMGAAGTRPDNKPLLPIRSDSTSSSVVEVGGPDTDLQRTLRPKRSMSDLLNGSFMKKKSPTASKNSGNLVGSVTDENVTNYIISAEPEDYEEENTVVVDDGLTPTMQSSSVMTSSSGIKSNPSLQKNQLNRMTSSNSSTSLPSSHRPIVAEPPKATPPPSLHAKPKPSSASVVSQQTNSSSSSLASNRSSSKRYSLLPDGEKKRYELQMRVYRARTQMPGHVLLRVFRDPAECVEVEEILAREEGNDTL